MEQQRQAERFLRGVIPPGVQGLFTCVVEVPVEEHPYAGLTTGGWTDLKRSFLPIHQGSRIDLIPTFEAGREWYFTPGLFNRFGTTQKEFCVGAATLWVDIDEPHSVDPKELEPHPSAIVESSPGKYHCYWFLEETLSVDVLEQYNRRLAYTIPGADHSGWDANQLLRIPAGINVKTGTIPTLVHLDIERRYDLAAFDGLPDDPSSHLGTDSLPPTPVGYIASEVVRQTLKERSVLLPEDLTALLGKKQPDRSRALWRMYHLCHQIELTREEAFWLIRGTQNDKFQTARHWDDELWRDLCAGYKDATAKRPPLGILERIRSVYMEKIPARDKYEQIAGIVAMDMTERGILYSDETNENRYLNTDTGESRTVTKYDEDFHQYMLRRYGINAAGEEFKAIYTHLVAACRENGPYQTHGVAFFDRDKHRLYINRYDNWVYRLDGDEVEVFINGQDGKFFREVPWAPPFKYIPRNQRPHRDEGRLLDEYVLSANIPSQQGADPDSLRTIIRTWLYAIFFNNLISVRPILFFHGEPGAGKTSVLVGIGQLFEGPSYSPLSVPDKEADFEFQVRNRDWVFYDNVDSPSKWLPDALARLATRFTVQARKLYTDNTQLRYPVRCFAALTAHSPKFRRDDVVDRLIPVRVEPFTLFKAQGDLDYDLETNRNLIWSELIDDLNRLVKWIRDNEGLPIRMYEFRLADFARFLEIVCELDGQEFEAILRVLKLNQASEALEEDEFVAILRAWLGIKGNAGKEVTARQLFLDLISLPVGADLPKQYTERGFAIMLGRKAKYLGHFVSLERPKEGIYVFDHKEDV